MSVWKVEGLSCSKGSLAFDVAWHPWPDAIWTCLFEGWTMGKLSDTLLKWLVAPESRSIVLSAFLSACLCFTLATICSNLVSSIRWSAKTSGSQVRKGLSYFSQILLVLAATALCLCDPCPFKYWMGVCLWERTSWQDIVPHLSPVLSIYCLKFWAGGACSEGIVGHVGISCWSC